MPRHAITVQTDGAGQWRAWCLLCQKGGEWCSAIGMAKADAERHARRPDDRPIDADSMCPEPDPGPSHHCAADGA